MTISLLCHAQSRPDGSITFDSKHHDFGEISETGGPVSHGFIFVNCSGKDVFIASARPSCSCVSVQYEHGTIHSGDSRQIRVTYDPSSLPGQFRQNVLVDFSDRTSTRLVVEGVVRERDKGIDESYPLFLSSELHCSSKGAKYGFIQQGTESIPGTFGIVNVSNEAVSISVSPSVPDPDLIIEYPQTLDAGMTSSIRVHYNISGNRLGTLSNELTVSVNGNQLTRTLALSGYAVKTLERTDASPLLRFEPTLVRFRPRGGKERVTLHNEGRSELHILKVETSAGVVAHIAAGTAIAPGEKLTFVLEKHRDNHIGDGYVRLFTDDPTRPARDIIYKTR